MIFTKESISKFIQQNREELKRKYKIEELQLFVSFASGLNNQDSDIDTDLSGLWSWIR